MIDHALIETRRAKAAAAWRLDNEVVLIGAGSAIGIPGGLDQCFEYRVHPEYFWLTGERRPGSVLAYSPLRGWTRFTPPVTESERVWDGIKDEPEGPFSSQLAEWLAKEPDANVLHLGAGGEGNDREHQLRELLTHVRRPKDESEIAAMRRAAVATAAGHAAAREHIRPGVTERELQIRIEAAFFLAGADRTGYHSIVGTGSNSAVFHFTPGQKAVGAEDLVLVDAGAECDGYVIDVTRTYAASGKFTAFQQGIYDVVLRALNECIAECQVGVEWSSVHYLAATVMAQGLIDLGVLKGDAKSAVDSEAIALFFPHGIGHMVGLGVRDASGAYPGRSTKNPVAGSNVRCNFPLEAGYVMTVEPGLYFIPALLNDADRRRRFSEFVNWDVVDQHADFGGVRLEDNILITDSGPVNLTESIPK